MTDITNPGFHEEDRKAFEKQRKEVQDKLGEGSDQLQRPPSSKGLKYLDPKNIPHSTAFDTSNLNAIKKVKKIYKTSVYNSNNQSMRSSVQEESNPSQEENPKQGGVERSREPQNPNNKLPFEKLSREEKIRLLEKEREEIDRKIKLLEQRKRQRMLLRSKNMDNLQATPNQKNKPLRANDKDILTSLHARAEGEQKALSRDDSREGGDQQEGEKLSVKTGRKSKKSTDLTKGLKDSRAKSVGMFAEPVNTVKKPSVLEKESKREESDVERKRAISRQKSSKDLEKSVKKKKKKKKSKKKLKIGEEETPEIEMNPIEFSDNDEEAKRSKSKKKKERVEKAKEPKKI